VRINFEYILSLTELEKSKVQHIFLNMTVKELRKYAKETFLPIKGLSKLTRIPLIERICEEEFKKPIKTSKGDYHASEEKETREV